MTDSALLDSIPVAMVQAPPVYLNLDASTQLAVDYIERAASRGAWLTAFPETWLPGYPVWLDYAPNASLWDHAPAKALFAHMVRECPTIPGPHIDQLHQAASRAGTHVVMGVQERDGATLYNTIVYLNADGVTRRIHRKLVPTYTERLVWGQGDGSTLGVMETERGNVGALVCWEHWMPLARAAMHAQRERVHVAQWPGVKELHQLASRHYAFEGQCHVLAVGTVLTRGQALAGFDSCPQRDPQARTLLSDIPGDDDTLLLPGASAVIAPDSSYVLAPAAPQDDLLMADLDLRQGVEGWMTLDTDGHYSRPDVFELTVNQKALRNVRFQEPPP
ncbi:MAG: carbon-nitrogen hydrolase family protein [Pseudomonadota bacterium]